ncbi:MAG: hypothetical protein DCF25_11850 [Leptolyngbya foveolarum]|uniref:DUF6876 domain-containing protein n=1 Tax=Leptolyngbya foveolarum TaxID=47253 RepID=A0A2W4VX28_9CYAN|nr:MAG: hypothetical protein DCF25_11850 [Leptolyngbya foveolarum]
MTHETLQLDLNQFTGTTQWHRWSRLTNLTCTDGAKYLADEAGAYWLLDEIALHQLKSPVKGSPRLQEFQIWVLTVNDDKSCRLTCSEDSDVAPVIVRDIELTDFPLQAVKLYVCNNVVLLPSEY